MLRTTDGLGKPVEVPSVVLLVLVDASKFNFIALLKVRALDEIDHLVCDSFPDQVLADSLSRNQVKVICNEY